jgi:Tfp pilus assembly protein FimT
MTNRLSGTPAPRSGGYSAIGVTGPLSFAAFLVSTLLSPVHHFIEDSRRCAVVNDLLVTMRQAQAVANTAGKAVSVCAAADDAGTRCAPTASWSRGWISFVDLDGDGRMDARESKFILQRTVNGNASVKVAGSEIAFTFRPFFAPSYSRRGIGVLSVCEGSSGKPARAVVVSPGLPPRAADPTRTSPRCV